MQSGNEYLWVIDPIDGTKSFITGAPNMSKITKICKKNRELACERLFLILRVLLPLWVWLPVQRCSQNYSEAGTGRTERRLSD